MGLQKVYLRYNLPIFADFSDRSQRGLVLPLLEGQRLSSKMVTEDCYDLKFLENVLKPGDVFFDIGSNIGVYAMCAARVVRSHGQVHCFEPLKENLRILNKNININNFASFVRVNDFGLLDSKSTFYFRQPKKSGSGCGMFVNKTGKNKDPERIVELETDTLDNYVVQRNIKKIDFMKIDVEGAEMSVLNGGINTLDKLRPKYIQIEFGRPHETSMDFSFKAQDIFSFLVKKGYKAFYFKTVKQILEFDHIDSVIDNSPGKHLNVIFELI